MSIFVDANADIIEYVYDYETAYFEFDHKNSLPGFSFTISDPIMLPNQQATPGAQIVYNPQSLNKLEKYGVHAAIHIIPDIMKNWMINVRKYEEISLSRENTIEKKYELDFVEYFKITDEDANEMPFNDEQQNRIINFWNGSKKRLIQLK